MTTNRLVLATLVALGACAQAPAKDPSGAAAVMAAPTTGSNSLTAAERAAGWKLLFDGTSLAAWRGYKQTTVPEGWRVADGTITKERPVEDIVSREQFGDFDLQIEWKIGEAGNSGIFYRGTEDEEKIYWTAPEYQLLDDIKASDNKTRLTCAGAAYGLYPSPEGHLKPVGEWNVTRIIAKGPHVEHWLNGFKLVEYDLWSPDWEAKVAASKFKAWPKYGRNKRGHLAMQGDHRGVLSFRSIKIRSLE
jgi:hypothetical protein